MKVLDKLAAVFKKGRGTYGKKTPTLKNMINTKHLVKVISAWISVVYIVCYAGVAIYPPIRSLFVKYSLHAEISLNSDFFGFGYFISGLIVWNIMAILGAWLFAALSNKIKQ